MRGNLFISFYIYKATRKIWKRQLVLWQDYNFALIGIGGSFTSNAPGVSPPLAGLHCFAKPRSVEKKKTSNELMLRLAARHLAQSCAQKFKQKKKCRYHHNEVTKFALLCIRHSRATTILSKYSREQENQTFEVRLATTIKKKNRAIEKCKNCIDDLHHQQ